MEETCNAIWNRVQPIAMPEPTTQTWIENERQFLIQCNFPNCVGAVDGKHIRIAKPWNAGSLYYNYKDFHSIVVQAVCSADLIFTVIDVGEYGRNSDGAVFKNSLFGQAFQADSLHLPNRKQLPNSVKCLPYVFLGDEAYPLRKHLMKPYSSRNLDNPKRVFNQRMSRARKSVERAFGIVTRKFEIFQRPIRFSVDRAVLVTKTAFLLHNFIRLRDGHFGEPSEIQPHGMADLELPRSSGRASAHDMEIRDAFKDYFITDAGNIPWITAYASVR